MLAHARLTDLMTEAGQFVHNEGWPGVVMDGHMLA
jgi:hypothetical protein